MGYPPVSVASLTCSRKAHGMVTKRHQYPIALQCERRSDVSDPPYSVRASHSISNRKSGCGSPATTTVVRAGYFPSAK